MRIGKLRHLVSLWCNRPTQQNAATGAIVDNWVLVADLWASIEPMSAREFVAAHAVQSEVTTRITIRSRAGVTAAMRIEYRGTIYNIVGVLADRESGVEYMTLPCSEGVNRG